MSKKELLISFYSKVLMDVGVFDATGEGMLSYTDGNDAKPVTISKKRLCLPLKNILQDPDWDLRIPYHPLSEQINQGPSPILNAMKAYVTERLLSTIRELSLGLMELAVEPKRHKGVKSKAAKYLMKMQGADQKTHDTLRKVLDAVSLTPERRLVSLFLVGNGGGEDGYLRSCKVSFPIMDEALNDNPMELFGVNMPRKTKDKALIANILEYVLGDETERASYTRGSADGEAPYFHCLLLSFYYLAKRLNDLIELHAPACPQLEGYRFNLDWADELMDFSAFAKTNGPSIPPLPGNRGLEDEKLKDELKRTTGYEQDEDDIGLTTDVVEKKSDVPSSSFADRKRREREDDYDRDRRPTSRSFRDRHKNDDRDDRSRDRDRDRRPAGGSFRDRHRDDRGGRNNW